MPPKLTNEIGRGRRPQFLEAARRLWAGSMATIIMGAAGAVGKRLCAALSARGTRVIATDRMEHMPGSLKSAMGAAGTFVGGVNVCDVDALRALFREHADEHTIVWNLAAPLSVETAIDPAVAEAVTVGGMENVLNAMTEVGARRICFTDSIGSFGATAPRVDATARWLHENPDQDPGSDYGRQKRSCRELMAAFARDHRGDPRFAVLPGVLHCEPVWGNGTTEYALDALLAAPHQQTKHNLPASSAYVCPVDPQVRVPMIFIDDLMRGLIALQDADEEVLSEPQRGYCIPGLSFSPNELFAEIRQHHPGFGFRVQLDENMNTFANTWPDELSTVEPMRDLGYAPKVGLSDMVAAVLAAHERRNHRTAKAFKAMDTDNTAMLNRAQIEAHIRNQQPGVRGREDYAQGGRDAVADLVDKLMEELDPKQEGFVSWWSFSEWNRRNSLEEEVWKQVNGMVDELRLQIRELGHVPRV